MILKPGKLYRIKERPITFRLSGSRYSVVLDTHELFLVLACEWRMMTSYPGLPNESYLEILYKDQVYNRWVVERVIEPWFEEVS